MTKKTQKSRSRHRTKPADDTNTKYQDRCVGTSKSYIASDNQEQTKELNTEDAPRTSLSISTCVDFRAEDNTDSPLPRSSETHLGFRSETLKEKTDKIHDHFLPEIVNGTKPLSWDDRLDEFCGQNTLDDVEFVRHSKQGIAFTQYVGEHHMPRVSSDGPRRYTIPRRPPHHLPRLHSDGSIPQRGNSQPQSRNTNAGLTREQTVQHRSGGGFIENVRNDTVQRRLDHERRHLQRSTRHLRETDTRATRTGGSNNREQPARSSNTERNQTSTSGRVQEVVGEQNRLRSQNYLRTMKTIMSKNTKKK